eukprot:1180889-Prorocentrum_minimum.AAC.5
MGTSVAAVVPNARYGGVQSYCGAGIAKRSRDSPSEEENPTIPAESTRFYGRRLPLTMFGLTDLPEHELFDMFDLLGAPRHSVGLLTISQSFTIYARPTFCHVGEEHRSDKLVIVIEGLGIGGAHLGRIGGWVHN